MNVPSSTWKLSRVKNTRPNAPIINANPNAILNISPLSTGIKANATNVNDNIPIVAAIE